MLEGTHPTPATMPADLFEGQNEPVKGVGFSTSIYANADMPEEEAYQITKAIMEGRESVQRSFGSMAGWTVEGAAADENLAVPLHPGAKKYYQEAAQAQ